MAEQRPNFLLGKGERLTEPVVVKPGGGPKVPPYTFAEARQRIAPMLTSAVKVFDGLPAKACPNDRVVGILTLNPEYLAKTAFPDELLQSVGLRAVGSRPRIIKPEKRSRDREAKETITADLFVSGNRSALRRWAIELPKWSGGHTGAAELASVEQFVAPNPADKVKAIVTNEAELMTEVVLHAGEFKADEFILSAFQAYLKDMQLEADLDHRIFAGGLCFLPLFTSKSKVVEIAKFTFLRAIREMPKLRIMRPAFRTSSIPASPAVLPSVPPMDPSIRAAIFDGGLPTHHPTTLWATAHDAPGVGAEVKSLLEHGQNVTSAALFGHLNPGEQASVPYGHIDHYRVLDGEPGENPLELYETLARIESVLASQHYDFVNLSIGPEVPIEDDEVHLWTAKLDEYLSDGKTLATIAVGNGGERDPTERYDRIQVPSDCVNGVSVGACDSRGASWKRCPYSSIGPGRSPGLVKPDLVSFGGSLAEPYLVLGGNSTPTLVPKGGTSFAAPDALRLAMGVRAHLGPALNPLAIRALLIHTCDAAGHPQNEVGWGRVASNVEGIAVCPTGTVRVVYQGEISPSKYIRAQIPVPAAPMTGMVTIAATVCYASATDPHHPSNYTRSGLEVAFRPHDTKFRPDAVHPTTKGFFGPGKLYSTEDDLRKDVHKWENCVHHAERMRAASLSNPVFDLHYNARMDGQNVRLTDKLKYALVITVEAPKVKDLYDQVLRRYHAQLEPLTPVIEIPVRT